MRRASVSPSLRKSRPTLVAVYESGGNAYAVRVVFSDETGLGSIKKEPLCVVVALMMNVDSQWDAVHSDCRKPWLTLRKRLKAKELKGHELLSHLRRKHDPEIDTVLRATMGTLAKHGVPVFYEAIDRAGLEKMGRVLRENIVISGPGKVEAEVDGEEVEHGPFGLGIVYSKAFGPEFTRKFGLPTDPYSIAFGLCVEQVDRYVHALIPREKILWISDHAPRFQTDLKDAAQAHKSHTAVERELLRRIHGVTDSFVSHLVDTIYFGDSKESFMLQLADVCCSVVVGHLLKQPIAEPYYEILRSAIVAERPIHGAG